MGWLLDKLRRKNRVRNQPLRDRDMLPPLDENDQKRLFEDLKVKYAALKEAISDDMESFKETDEAMAHCIALFKDMTLNQPLAEFLCGVMEAMNKYALDGDASSANIIAMCFEHFHKDLTEGNLQFIYHDEEYLKLRMDAYRQELSIKTLWEKMNRLDKEYMDMRATLKENSHAYTREEINAFKQRFDMQKSNLETMLESSKSRLAITEDQMGTVEPLIYFQDHRRSRKGDNMNKEEDESENVSNDEIDDILPEL